MDVAGSLAEFRRVTGDTSTPPLWSDEDFLAFYNDAINEACERARLIEDRLTPSCCLITLQAGVDTYPLAPSVIGVKRASFNGRPLEQTSVEKMDSSCSGWETRTGHPEAVIVDESALRVVWIPTADINGQEVNLTVWRRPLLPRTLTGPDSVAPPDIPERYHLRLLSWVYKRAYSVDDPEMQDANRAATYDGLFTADFGARVDANVQRKRRDKRPPVVRFRF
jgi:hypothetical protein